MKLAPGVSFDPLEPNRPWRPRQDVGGVVCDVGADAMDVCSFAATSTPTRVAAFGRARNSHGTSDRLRGVDPPRVRLTEPAVNSIILDAPAIRFCEREEADVEVPDDTASELLGRDSNVPD